MALIGAMAAMASAGMVCSCGAGLGSGGRGAGSGSAWKIGPGRPPAYQHVLIQHVLRLSAVRLPPHIKS